VAAFQSSGVSSVRFFSCTPVDLRNVPETSADVPAEGPYLKFSGWVRQGNRI